MFATSELVAAAYHLLAPDEASLVEIGQTLAFPGHGIDFALQPGELRSKQFVIGGRAMCRHRVFAGQEHIRSQQGVADPFEDKGVELIGTNVAPRATTMLAACPERIVVATVAISKERAAFDPAHRVA